MSKVVTICGSMRFFQNMLETARDLSLKGNIVLMPFVTFLADEQLSEAKRMLDEMHFEKIDMSDSICVVTQSDYVGESTRREIGYAMLKHKAVTYSDYPPG